MEDSPQKIRHKEDSPHNKCDQEFERNRRTNICNSANVEDSPHNGDRLGLGGGSGELGGVGFREVEVGGVGVRGLWSGELGRGIGVGGFPILPTPPDPKPPTPPSQPNPSPPRLQPP